MVVLMQGKTLLPKHQGMLKALVDRNYGLKAWRLLAKAFEVPLY
jgi:hypothetical protein